MNESRIKELIDKLYVAISSSNDNNVLLQIKDKEAYIEKDGNNITIKIVKN